MAADDDMQDYRLGELERRVAALTQHAVSREWLEERLARIDDAIASARRDTAADHRSLAGEVKEIKDGEKARRTAVYAAVVSALLAVVTAIVIAALQLGA